MKTREEVLDIASKLYHNHLTIETGTDLLLGIADARTQRETLNDFFEYLDSLTKEQYNADSLDGHKRAYLKSL